MFKNKKVISLFLFISGVIAVLLFQNCSKGFEATSARLSGQSAQLTSLDDGFKALSCIIGDRKLAPGEFIEGYERERVLSPETCRLVMRTCLSNGSFDGTVPLADTCASDCLAPNGETIRQGEEFISFSRTTGSVGECNQAMIVSKCTGGAISPAPAGSRTCKTPDQMCEYPVDSRYAAPSGSKLNDTVMGFTKAQATFPDLCGQKISSSCQANGKWTPSSPLFAACTQSCLNPFTNTADTKDVLHYKSETEVEGECKPTTSKCQPETGTYIPAIRFRKCEVVSSLPAHYTFEKGQAFEKGKSFKTKTGSLTMQTDGNFVILAGESGIWSTMTNEPNLPAAGRVKFQEDGNLVIFSSTGYPMAHSNTHDKGEKLVLQSDNNLAIFDKGQKLIWSTYSHKLELPETITFYPGQFDLKAGERIRSKNGYIEMQTDGNFVISEPNGTAWWGTSYQMAGIPNILSAKRAIFQGDGNLVLFDADGIPLASTNSAYKAKRLVFQTDKNLVAIDESGTAFWSIQKEGFKAPTFGKLRPIFELSDQTNGNQVQHLYSLLESEGRFETKTGTIFYLVASIEKGAGTVLPPASEAKDFLQTVGRCQLSGGYYRLVTTGACESGQPVYEGLLGWIFKTKQTDTEELYECRKDVGSLFHYRYMTNKVGCKEFSGKDENPTIGFVPNKADPQNQRISIYVPFPAR
jgi:hypothetical protein